MKVSVLVVSRTAARLNEALASLDRAYSGSTAELEVLISWNGTRWERSRVCQDQRFQLQLFEQTPYHFAANVNALARLARGDVLVLLNDDVILDAGALDAALLVMADEAVAVVGGRLRTRQGLVSHIGIAFDPRHSAYHRLRHFPHDCEPALREGPVPAVTGALLAVRRQEFLAIGLDERYQVCGEDVEFCLRLRALGRMIWYCPAVSGIHDGEATRSEVPGQQPDPEDQERLRQVHQKYLAEARPEALKLEWFSLAEECDHLRRQAASAESPPQGGWVSRLDELTLQLARAMLDLDDLRHHSEVQARTIDSLQRHLLHERVDQEDP